MQFFEGLANIEFRFVIVDIFSGENLFVLHL
jgi:hypothetical protein